MQTKTKINVVFMLVGMILLSGCNMPSGDVDKPLSLEQMYDQMKSTLTYSDIENNIYQQTEAPSQASDENETINDPIGIYLHPGLPVNFIPINDIEKEYSIIEDRDDADIKVLMGPVNSTDNNDLRIDWIYALAAPFYTTQDSVGKQELSELWRGERSAIGNFSRIYITESTKAAVSTIFGSADDRIVNTITPKAMGSIPLDDSQSLMILPFEDLNQRYKVIQIDQQSPIKIDFDPQNYLLTAAIWVESTTNDENISLPGSNYDPNLRTVLVMTGVTALTRATAYRMEVKGNQYPGQDIQDWLTSADLTHISNEVPFAVNCPSPDPVQQNLIFCSSPDRIELLEIVGTDIVELSGNHLLDYGLEAVNKTLDMYEEREWETYAGGWDLEDARSPAIINHNGNQLAFIGCNSVGPPNAWASETKPGAAPCGEFLWMVEEIKRLKTDGYIPIVTLQYAEDYTAYPSSKMFSDFHKLADAGAAVVNGSQAHTPKMMSFHEESFLHYGLGNLFFDQMQVYYNDVYLSGTRDEFIDRLIFYDGKLISIELLTALLEDYARPRPMTTSEREAFLSRIFSTAADFDQ